MAGNTVRLERTQSFTIVSNDILRDKELSLKTKGLFAILASLPSDWKHSIAGLAKAVGVGKDAIRSSLAELEKAGYLTREQKHNEDGRFAGYDYVIHEHRVSKNGPLSGNPTTVFPTTVFPTTVTPTHYKKGLIKETSIDTPYSPPAGDVSNLDTKSMPRHKPERFTGFWTFYPKHVKRERAVRAWDRLKPSDELIDTMGRALKVQVAYWKAMGTELQYIPHASTWLNGREWENDPEAYRLPAQDSTAGWAPDTEVL